MPEASVEKNVMLAAMDIPKMSEEDKAGNGGTGGRNKNSKFCSKRNKNINNNKKNETSFKLMDTYLFLSSIVRQTCSSEFVFYSDSV